MSFEITPFAGTVQELNVDLSKPSQHEREEFVIEEVKKAIYHIVTSLGGYLSVSCNGNINPVPGETGDLVQIYITSLPAPPVAATPEPVENQEGIGSLNPEGKTNEEIEKEAQENIKVAQEKSVIEESAVLPVDEPTTGVPAQQETAPAEQSQELTQPPVIESTPSPTIPTPMPSQPVENPPVVSEQPES